ncbi:methyltransferase family protein [Candidatus Leptofilum sp.]|uniref:methyltransferase family protein n=1 Tax=Candidatus Leptofilum sp. TaxID=3241576 RepID=UPI003B5CCA12
MPELKLGILNGWLFFVAYLAVFGVTMFSFPTAVRARLYDRSLWTKRQRTLSAAGKLFSLANMILFVFSPIRSNSPLLIFGVGLWVLGLFGLETALFNYKNTPLDEPVTTGVYKISRNPQIFSIWIIFAGICFIIGSGLSLLLLAVSIAFLHTLVLAEEEACLKQYGDSYKAYMATVPRYFLFF